ncbi:hypothetical protein ACFQL4_17730 [Halosimplex aquaticum]
MTPIEILAALVALASAVSIGLVAHELAHAAVLRAAGVPHVIDWFPGSDGGLLQAGLRGEWAAVRPRPGAETPAWLLRVSAMMPLALVAPLALVPVGVVADPFASEGSPGSPCSAGWPARCRARRTSRSCGTPTGPSTRRRAPPRRLRGPTRPPTAPREREGTG